MHPWFITVEGGEAVGKSTLLKTIEEFLNKRGTQVLCTREPGGTDAAEAIRTLILQYPVKPLTELFLYEAARVEHLEHVIRPALKQGINVLCDRFTHSTLAYQGVGRKLGKPLVAQLNDLATQGLKPNATIWLKLDPKIAQMRSKLRGQETRYDQEKLEFHLELYSAFEAMSSEFIVLDASLPTSEVFAQLLKHPKWVQLVGAS